MNADGSVTETVACEKRQLHSALGHADVPLAGFTQLGIATEVGLQFARDLLFLTPTAEVLGHAGDDGGGGLFAIAGDGLDELHFIAAFGRNDGGADIGEKYELLVPQRFDQAELASQGGQQGIEHGDGGERLTECA
ncbi:MAG: hypothetical protein Q7S40_29415 [Opitutaceae bacterium]|nr:hypothetical protein [Opitutaceae bacterium]